ncbi:hypothetical protein [Streptomyces sp. NPDC012825]|uniref:hypothetical protein n=1 Tax=Streptomyces sp. NPDC012825 TaxID=3364851 RepID=UPI0036C39C1B
MRITIDTDTDTETESYADAATCLRTAYAPSLRGRASMSYLGKFVLEPLPADTEPAERSFIPVRDERPTP